MWKGVSKLQKEWLEKEQLMKQLMKIAPTPMYLRALKKNNTCYVNNAAVRLLGYSKEELSAIWSDFGKRIMHPEDFARLKDHEQNLINPTRKQHFEFEYRLKLSDGKWHWYRSYDTIFQRDPDNHQIQVFGTIVDITEHKDLERQKNAFFRIATHELRNPLTGLMAYLSLSRRNIDHSHPADALLQRAYNCSLKMKTLIQDFLDVNSMQQGIMTYEISDFDFDKMVEDTFQTAKSLHSSHDFELSGQPAGMLRGDPQRLAQAISNLLNIAVKYSGDENRIKLSYYRKEGTVQLIVRNYGPGIEPDRLLPFVHSSHQGEIDRSLKVMALGLYLVQQIVTSHNGKVHVASEAGEGITFTIKLPI